MELNSIKDAFDRVTKKQKLSTSKSLESIDQITQEINTAISSIQTKTTPHHNSILNDLKTKLKQQNIDLDPTQKDLNIAFSKYTKLLDKNLNPDISKSYRHHIDFDFQTVNQIVACHLYREGLFEIADSFVTESTTELTESNKQVVVSRKNHFLEMHEILASLKKRDVGPALDWAVVNRETLIKNGSDIEMKLHRLKFVEIVKSGRRDDALRYARAQFPRFAGRHFGEIQRLMASLLWVGREESSPYSDLLSPSYWGEVVAELVGQFCNLVGEGDRSPVAVAVAAGVQGLPTLLKLMSVMSGKRREWEGMKQLPVPVDLDEEFQFHSIFVCPVSREQAAEDNPPMMMSCGHVLCKQSITKLSKNISTRPFKCPYCPTEVEVGQCRQLYF